MLTGDHPASAERIARKLGIGSVHAALTPEQKLAKVTALKEQQGQGGGVIMVRLWSFEASLSSIRQGFWDAMHGRGWGLIGVAAAGVWVRTAA